MSRGNPRPTIAIAGAGLTGAYLHKLLRNQGLEADLFDIEHGTKCGLHPCAWGTSMGFTKLVDAAALHPENYILRRFDHLLMDDIRVKADLMTIDKPRLIGDLLQGAEINYSPLKISKYERGIDATGVARALLPAIENDTILPCVQSRVRTDEILENRIKLGGIGYAWCFPLTHTIYHIGCGSLLADPHMLLEELGWLGSSPSPPKRQIVCECHGKIRLTSPHYSQPFVSDSVWGVGEAIGCVAPLAGDGIVTGMRSIQILVDHWDDPNGYTKAILREFDWMKDERRVIDKLLIAESLGIHDARVLKRNSRRMGMRIGLRNASILMKALR